MALVALKELLAEAMRDGYAVGGFDAGEHGFAEAIIQAAEETGAPLVLMIPESFLKFVDMNNFFVYLTQRIRSSPVRIDLHLDHASSYESCLRAIHYGFTSVMFDGSLLPYEENIYLTRKVVEAAHAAGVSVEAELGHVGGDEKTLAKGYAADERFFTEPDEAADFVERTGVDALAISFGTVHGVYRGAPKLDLERLSAIRSRVAVPLVMHGGSGLSDEDFKNAIKCGINKINYFTAVSFAAVEAIKEGLAEKEGKIFYPELIARALEKAKEAVIKQIEVFGTKRFRG